MRVGLEYNIRLPKGAPAKSNYKSVELAVKASKILGRNPATQDEAHCTTGINNGRERTR